MNNIKTLAEKYSGEIIKNRHWLHMHPELGNEEFETSKFIQDKLSQMGVKFTANVANTGVVALIKGNNPKGKTVLIRADMDALPMEEKNDIPYKSTNDGRCHSCGHDVHTATLLGTARVLNAMKDELNGNVKLVFQPAEEASQGGAELMVKEGILENPTVDFAVAMHVDPTVEVGSVCIEKGAVTSYPDFFSITFKGKGAHGSFPSNSNDPILPLISAYNMISLIPKKVSPLEPCVVQVCMLQAGSAQAVIPNESCLQGTVRTLSLKNREIVKAKLEAIAKNVSEIFGVEYEFNYRGRCSPVINDDKLTDFVRETVADIFDKGFSENISMKIGGEDFCFISDKVPSVMMLVGSSNDDPSTKFPVHNPYFNIDESLMTKAVTAFVKITKEYLDCN